MYYDIYDIYDICNIWKQYNIFYFYYSSMSSSRDISRLFNMKLSYINVSGRNNNCFYNSIFEVLKYKYGQISIGSAEITSGSKLRKILTKIMIVEEEHYFKVFKDYLVLAKNIISIYIAETGKQFNSMTDFEKNKIYRDSADMLSVNATEVEALISNNILKINLDNAGVAKKIMQYLKVKGRIPNQVEKDSVRKYLLEYFKLNIIDIRILPEDRKKITNYINGKFDAIIDGGSDSNLIELKQSVINIIKMHIDKINEYINSEYPKKLQDPRVSHLYKECKDFCIILTDNEHYNVMSIDNRLTFNLEDLNKFIAWQYDENFDKASKNISLKKVFDSKNRSTSSSPIII